MPKRGKPVPSGHDSAPSSGARRQSAGAAQAPAVGARYGGAGWADLAFARAPIGGALTSADGRLLLVNAAFAAMLGYTPAELEGRHFSQITDPRDVSTSVDAFERLLAETGEIEVEKRYTHADGGKVWVRIRAALIGDVAGDAAWIVVQSEDIGERRAAERRLRRSEAFLHRLFDSSAVPKALLDKNGRAVQVNRAMLALTGRRSFDELAGDLMLGHVAAPHDTAIRDLCRSRSRDATFEARLMRADGTVATVLCLMGAATSPGGAPWMIVQMVDISDRKAEETRSAFRSSHDELTGLANRRMFVTKLKAALDRRGRPQKTAVLMIDLNRFKEINDGLGHGAGDAILVEVARRLESVTRQTDTIGRIGGDEFWVVAPRIADDIDAVNLATAILRALSQPFWIDRASIHVGASVGFCLAPDDGTAAQTLMSRADAAQYRAKALASGWAGYSRGSDEQRLQLLELAADLRTAIDSEKLDIVYQPLFAATGGVVGFEALSRWNHPERGAIPPDVFIPLAEHARLMPALTRTVLRRAARQCAQWRAAGHDVSVAVNLAPSLLGQESLTELVTDELTAAGLPAEHLTMEITEGRLADGADPVIAQALLELHRLGLRLSIDDFGTGYSSLAYLKELPVDELKIDRSFITHLATDSRDLAIVRSLVDLAKILHLEVVAEGVESLTAAAHLRAAGCDFLQGFGLGRPRPAGHGTALLTTQGAANTRSSDRPPPPAERSLNIVLADSNHRTGRSLARALGAAGHQVRNAEDGAEVLTAVHDGAVEMVVLSQVMTGELSGVQTAAALRASGYTDPIVIRFWLAPARGLRARRFPIDVWPVAKSDRSTLLHLVKGCATRAPRNSGTPPATVPAHDARSAVTDPRPSQPPVFRAGRSADTTPKRQRRSRSPAQGTRHVAGP